MKYIWVKNDYIGREFVDQARMLEIMSSSDYSEKTDKFYQVGSEVKLKISIEPVPIKRQIFSSTGVNKTDIYGHEVDELGKQ